jgi:hypothetical protein
VYVTDATEGQVHKKKFSTHATTATQDTANLYVAGEFSLSVEKGEPVLYPAGSCSFDQDIVFPLGAVVTETALKNGLRICVSPVSGKWTRRVASGSFIANARELLIPISGAITISGKEFSAGSIVSVGGEQAVKSSGRVFVARTV